MVGTHTPYKIINNECGVAEKWKYVGNGFAIGAGISSYYDIKFGLVVLGVSALYYLAKGIEKIVSHCLKYMLSSLSTSRNKLINFIINNTTIL